METNLERIRNEIEMLSRFNETPGNGITRFSYSNADRQARDYLIDRFRELGLTVSVDGVGNIRARLAATDPRAPIVMTGSHIDTVAHGGRFDGVVGVVGALEVVRAIVENDIRMIHPIEVVVFVEEEGSNFMTTMAGSKTLIGKYRVQDLKRIVNEKGVSMYDMARQFGLSPDESDKYVIRPGEIKAMIEMHVEQAAVLYSEHISLGIVEAIVGIKTFVVEMKGVSNHAGATPMYLRQNPLSAAATVISQIDHIVSSKGTQTTVATTGKILCSPNIPNVIPEKVVFTVDVRDVDPEGIEATVTEIRRRLDEEALRHRVDVKMDLVGEAHATRLSELVIGAIEEAAQERSVVYKRMNSGAVHDSQLLAEVTNVGMIFVPSINGRSHVPEEDTSYQDIKRGADVLLGTVMRLAKGNKA